MKELGGKKLRQKVKTGVYLKGASQQKLTHLVAHKFVVIKTDFINKLRR